MEKVIGREVGYGRKRKGERMEEWQQNWGQNRKKRDIGKDKKII